MEFENKGTELTTILSKNKNLSLDDIYYLENDLEMDKKNFML
jgi:hypothetical protein